MHPQGMRVAPNGAVDGCKITVGAEFRRKTHCNYKEVGSSGGKVNFNLHLHVFQVCHLPSFVAAVVIVLKVPHYIYVLCAIMCTSADYFEIL